MARKPYKRTSSGWSDERRAKHSAAIRTWSPWKNATGPRTEMGKSISRCNALKHGATSRPAKDFMRSFNNYRKFLRLCWAKRNSLARQEIAKQKNELLNMKNAKVSSNKKSSLISPSRHSGAKGIIRNLPPLPPKSHPYPTTFQLNIPIRSLTYVNNLLFR